MAKMITASSAIITLTIPGVFSVPQRIQGFGPEDIYSLDDTDNVETSMSLDGLLSGGWVPVSFKQAFTLMANSPSKFVFDNWSLAQRSLREVLPCNGTVILPSINAKFTQTKGFLKGYKAAPEAGKTLKPIKFGIEWESIVPAAA